MHSRHTGISGIVGHHHSRQFTSSLETLISRIGMHSDDVLAYLTLVAFWGVILFVALTYAVR